MEYKKHFNSLLEYNYWANDKVAASIRDNNLSSGKPIELYSHILNAEVICLNRAKEITNYEFKPFLVRSIEECDEVIKSTNIEWNKFIKSLPENDFEKLIKYKNIRNEDTIIKIWEIIIHMINHSTYHRGQIAASLRSMNIQPPVTDFAAHRNSINCKK
jgi:uncharacterized damage-inducible protein DinB